jgi:hypothetical protein
MTHAHVSDNFLLARTLNYYCGSNTELKNHQTIDGRLYSGAVPTVRLLRN